MVIISGNINPAGTGNEIRIIVDAAGHLQVDIVAALPAGANTIGAVYITDGVDDADVVQLITYINPNLDQLYGLVTASLCYGRRTSGEVSELRIFIAESTFGPNFDGQTLLGTHALMSARVNATQTTGLVADNIIPGALLTQQIEHYEVHQGELFIFSDVRIIPAATNLDYHIMDVGGATTDEMHANIIIRVDAAVEITIYENPTLSNDGTLLTAHNKNRNTAGAPGTTFYHTPTVTNVGTEIYNGAIMSATSPPHAAGGRVKGTNEWVFDSGDAYLIRIAGAQSDNVSIEIEFYEE